MSFLSLDPCLNAAEMVVLVVIQNYLTAILRTFELYQLISLLTDLKLSTFVCVMLFVIKMSDYVRRYHIDG